MEPIKNNIFLDYHLNLEHRESEKMQLKLLMVYQTIVLTFYRSQGN